MWAGSLDVAVGISVFTLPRLYLLYRTNPPTPRRKKLASIYKVGFPAKYMLYIPREVQVAGRFAR